MLTLAALLMAFAGVAVATGGGGKPDADAAAATFMLTPTENETEDCEGEDGAFRDSHSTYTGTSTSADPRLSGELTLRTHTLLDLDERRGTTHGKLYLRDPATDRLKAFGHLRAVNTQLGKLDGFIVGKTVGNQGGTTGGPGPDYLYANFTAMFNVTGTEITGEMGQPPANDGGPSPTASNSAVFFEGSCLKHGHHGHGHDHGHGDHGHGHHGHGGRDDD
jgi:hypothetical protein